MIRNKSNSSLSVSQKDLTFGRRLSMKIDVVRRTCSDMLGAETSGTNCAPGTTGTSDESVGKKQLAAEYHRRSTMTAAASFADGHNNNNNYSHSDFYPNASDRKLIQENIAATRQIMDLKLQVADLLSKNDALEHENRQLLDDKSRLETDRDDTKLDLDKAYDRINHLKRERDEAVRDLTRARMLQIREDSRRAKLLGRVADGADDDAEHQQQQAKKNGSTWTATTATTTTNGSGRSHASSSSASSLTKGSSTSLNSSGWFRRWNHRRDAGESPASPTTSRKKLPSSPTCTSEANTATATNNFSRGSMFAFLSVIDDTKKKNETASEEQVVLPGRRTSHELPTQDWGSAHNAPILIRPSQKQVMEKQERPEQATNTDISRRGQCALQRKDTESDVNAFFSSVRRKSNRSYFYDDDDTFTSDESSGSNKRDVPVSKDHDEALARNQSRLPFDDYQHTRSSDNAIGGKQNATWDDIACNGDNDDDGNDDDDSINRDESFVYRVVQEKQSRHDSQTLILPGKLKRLSLDSTESCAAAGRSTNGEGGLEPLPRRRSLNACEA